MIRYSKKLIRFAEAWEGEALPTRGVDVIREFQARQHREKWPMRRVHTAVIDLAPDPELIFSRFKPGTRYEIRRAINEDAFTVSFVKGELRSAQLGAFYRFYDQFAATAGQRLIDRRWLNSMCRSGQLILSNVTDEDGQALVWHAYYVSAARATLLHSASHFRSADSPETRQRIGRANRLLHWQDMLHFKRAGSRTYDLGGWYIGKDDPDRLRINHFKEQFGGEIIDQITQEGALTLRGALFLYLRNRLVDLS